MQYPGSPLGAALLIACPPPALPAQQVERINVDSSGNQSSAARPGGVSRDGRFATFHSIANDLVPGDTNDAYDVFVRDRLTGTTTRVSVGPNGAQGDGDSQNAAISGDGRFVAFSSHATNLVPNDTNGVRDCFVHDRQTGKTTRVSVTTSGGEGDGDSVISWLAPNISDDGRWVAFVSSASNLVPGDTNGLPDVFLHDRSTGSTVRVTPPQANHLSNYCSISGDGSSVAYQSYADNLVAGDNNGNWDVFVYERSSGRTTRASVGNNGAEGNGLSCCAQISYDGRFVAFLSYSDNLVPGDTNQNNDVFRHDMTTGTTTRVSVAWDGSQVNGVATESSIAISASGRFVAFCNVGRLVPEDLNGPGSAGQDVFVRDVELGTTHRASTAADGSEAHGRSWPRWISDDGRLVAFSSEAPDLVDSDTNGAVDCFIKELRPAIGQTTRYCVAAPNAFGPAGASISLLGSTSVSSADFRLHADQATPGSGYFVFGSHQGLVPMGAGFECVFGVGRRLQPPVAIDAGGSATLAVDLASLTSVFSPGSTWNFQLIYRDASGTGPGFNFSDALSVTLAP